MIEGSINIYKKFLLKNKTINNNVSLFNHPTDHDFQNKNKPTACLTR